MTPKAVVLLDLHAREDSFQDDDALGVLGARLENAGHRVALARSALSAEPLGSAAWHGRLAQFVREGDFEVAVVARAWDPRTLPALREALRPGGRVLLLGAEGGREVGAGADAVVDAAGALALLRGEPVVAPGRLSAATLRRAAAGVERAPRRLTAVVLSGARARPSLSGPVSGCPYLVDAALRPPFDGLGLDPSRVQTRGCSFCLDNTGAYAAASEEELLRAWLTQLRRLRAETPELREVLLVDERPHEHLPAFFRALRDEPGLGPLELLVKSRVDWLLELADSALAEAAALAAESGSVLHLYLVGFENFDPWHLELFNKGHTAQENVEAIAKLRELEQRFPRSFEFRRYRAHGLVLFTPWTGPEALLENARRMREVRFEDLRADALSTRLRLYPRVALHALAERDGLLAEAFPPSRPDRAGEQGYNASVPWRFRDARTEAVFQAAQALRQSTSSLSDADVLELVTRHLLRWPGLEQAPEVAALALSQAVRSWGFHHDTVLRGLGPLVLGFDLEVEAIRLGLRRAALKEGHDEDADGLVRAYLAMGLFAAVVERHGLARASGAHLRGDTHAMVAVASDEKALAELLEAQRRLAEGGAARGPHARTMGRLLGYPACCVEAFLEQPLQGDNVANERRPFLRASGQALAAVLNRLGAVRLVSHHLCSPACAHSQEVAEALLAAVEDLDPRAATWISAELSRAVLFLDYERRLWLDGAWEGTAFRVDRASAPERHLLPFAAERLVSLRLEPTVVRAGLRGGETVEVPADQPLLLTPGLPLGPAALAALGEPPGAPGPLELPDAFRPGVAVRGYRILAVSAASGEREVVLGREGHQFAVRLRRKDPGRPAVLSKGQWAIDLNEPLALPEEAREALALLVRALPPGPRPAK